MLLTQIHLENVASATGEAQAGQDACSALCSNMGHPPKMVILKGKTMITQSNKLKQVRMVLRRDGDEFHFVESEHLTPHGILQFHLAFGVVHFNGGYPRNCHFHGEKSMETVGFFGDPDTFFCL